MSRSALQRNLLRKPEEASVNPNPNPPNPIAMYPPPFYPNMMMGYPPNFMNFPMGSVMPPPPPLQYSVTAGGAVGMMPYFNNLPQQQEASSTSSLPFVPIKLSGDEDDIDDPAHREKNTVPMIGNNSTYNINALLHRNILESEYFKALYNLKTYHEVLEEIRICVNHVEPWQTGTSRLPSSAFCLILKLMLMKLTYKQMNGILNAEDNNYIKAIGFLYLRYTCPPADLWKWFESFLEDEEEILPSSNREVKMSVGAYCIKLLTDMQYFGTMLPRIPVPIERNIKVRLLLLEEKKKRRRENLCHVIKGLLSAGAKVKAIYADADNEPAWYEAIIDSKEDNEDGQTFKYWVTFPEYGNQELIDLGDIEVLNVPTASGDDKSYDRDKIEKRSHSPEGKGKSGQRDKDHNNKNRDVRGRSDSRDRDRGDRDRERDRDRDRGSRHGGRERDRDKGHSERHRDSGRRNRSRSQSRSRSGNRRRRTSSSRSQDRDGSGAPGNDGHSHSPNPSDGSNHGRDDQGGAASKSNQQQQSLMEKVLQKSREDSLAVGRNYGNRPVSYKGSLSLRLDRYTVRKESPDRDRDRRDGGRRRRSRSRSGGRRAGGGDDNSKTASSSSSSAMTKSSMTQEQINKMKKLKEIYGDASGSSSM